MRCPFCGKERDRVLDSRPTPDGEKIRRRRVCLACKRRYTTYEQVDELKLYVVKKDGRREPYNREKIINGLMLACKKLPISLQQIEDIVMRIEGELYEKYKNEVKAQDIGDMVMQELKNLNHVAYVRFASYYREFKDVDEFVAVAKEVRPRRQRALSRSRR